MQLGTTRFLRFVIDRLRGHSSLDSRVLLDVMSGAGIVNSSDLRREEAVKNLRGNLRELAEKCKQEGIVLIVCTVASNERGFAPAFNEPDVAEDEFDLWNNEINLGLENFYIAPDVSMFHFASAVDIAGEHAWSLFHYARALELLGKADLAQSYYLRARDADPYPWRASSEINKTLKDVSEEVGTHLIDIENIFRESSPVAGIGWELMDDHLHPSSQVNYFWLVVGAKQ